VGGAVTGVPWWRALPAVETWVPCGEHTHPVRWADGTLSLPAHPDAEGEAVLAALGGEKAGCLEVTEAWHRHGSDLDMLAVGPRGPDDDVGVSWDEVLDFRENRLGGRFGRRPSWGGGYGGGLFGGTGRPGSRPMIPAGGGGPVGGGALAGGIPGPSPELVRLRAERLEMLTLLALGPAFQQLLAGTIAAAWADGGARAAEAPAHQPALEAALTGRLAPAAAAWLGVEPDLVDARLGDGGTGGGEFELTGTRAGRRLQAVLPLGWLASVWAPGLAVVAGHLVVAVEQAAWPDATVLAVPAPGQPPVRLVVRAVDGETGTDVGGPGYSIQWAHWEQADSREAGGA
jgi:hypothetical protein